MPLDLEAILGPITMSHNCSPSFDIFLCPFGQKNTGRVTEASSSSTAKSTSSGFGVLLGVTVAAMMFVPGTLERVEVDSLFFSCDSRCLEEKLLTELVFLISVVGDGAIGEN
eukprot:CAMPEP_0170978046 /NCGR_PEP_ID=MMETSP0736-20130129/959_1 /TAXON_ID=186038 /ORGANISM="Fragilariopsis kerguelensis, Strain L26-C5" /LENGTH=111 /DNA_ID=CAMNT_0011400327 /DNA_START=188 /DNA_END=524 /DNA_ORIENTATION=+